MSANEIKAVLTLDDSGFTIKVKQGTEALLTLDKQFKGVGDSSKAMEGSIGNAGKILSSFMQQTSQTSATLTRLAGGVDTLNNQLKMLVGALEQGGSGARSMGESARKGAEGADAAARATKGYAVALDAIKPSLRATADGVKTLAVLEKQAAEASELAASVTGRAKARALEAEAATNTKIIEERRALIRQLDQMERQYRQSANEDQFLATSLRRQKKAGLNGQANDAEARAAGNLSWAAAAQQQSAAQEKIVSELQKKNAEIVQSISLIGQEAAAAREAEAVAQAAARLKREEASALARMERDNEAYRRQQAAEAAAQTRQALRVKEEALRVLQQQERAAAAEKRSELAAQVRMEQDAIAYQREALRQEAVERRQAAALARQQAREDVAQKRADERERQQALAAQVRMERDNEEYMRQQQRQADAERAAAARALAEQQRQAALETRRQAQDAAQMWKGIAALWGASKIEGGIKGSVNSASDMQRAQLYVKGLNLPADQEQYINDKSWDDSRVLKFVSALDMVRARMAAIGGLGQNNVQMIDAVLQKAVTASNNIQTLTGDHSPEGMENMVRNIFGVIEARGQTNNPTAAKGTIDLIQKIYEGTGGKIDIADLETYFRRDLPGAGSITDQGVEKLVAFLDTVKVSGGHQGQGGAGAGVSTIGTAVKMFQKIANGGLKTERGAAEFADAGLIDMDQFNSLDGKALNKALRQSNLTVGSLSMSDPVAALQNVANAALNFVTRPENIKKFFGDASTSDPQARQAALNQFFQGLGMTNTALGILQTASNPAMMERAAAQQRLIENAKGADALNDDKMKTFAGNMQAFSSSLTNLKVTLGNSILPELTNLVKWLNEAAQSLADFFKGDQFTAKFTMMSAGIAGVTLAVKGFVSMFGAIGFKGMFSGMTDALVGFVAAGIGRMGAFGTAVGVMGSTVGAVFKRLIPVVGELLLAWDFAQIIAHLKVGGAEIQDWAASLIDTLWTKFQNFWSWMKESAKIKIAVDTGDMAAVDKAMRDGEAERAENQREHDTKDFNNGTASKEQRNRLAAENSPFVPDAGRRGGFDSQGLLQSALGPSFGQPLIFATEAMKASAAAQKDAAAAANANSTYIRSVSDSDRRRIDSAGDRPRRSFEDLYVGSIARLTEERDRLRAQASAVESRQGLPQDAIHNDAVEKFTAAWMSGQFDIGHDPKNRKWAGRQYDESKPWNETDAQNAAKAPEAQTWIRLTEEVEKYKKQIELTDQANKMLANTEINEKAASAALANDRGKESQAMIALRREIARMGEEYKRAGQSATEFARISALAIGNQATADIESTTAGLQKKIEELAGQLEQKPAKVRGVYASKSDSERLDDQVKVDQAESQSAIEALNRVLQTNTNLTDENRDAISKQIQKIRESILAENQAAEQVKRYQDELKARQEAGPVWQTVRDWQNATKQMQTAENTWLNSFADQLSTALDGGRFKFKAFLLGILQDMQKMLVKGTLGDLISTLFPKTAGAQGMTGGFMSSIMEKFGFGSSKPSGTGTDEAATTAAKSLTNLATASDKQTSLFGGLGTAFSSVVGSVKTGFGDLFNGLGSMLSSLMSSLGGAASSAGSWLGSLFSSGSGVAASTAASAFANGGIMTSMGRMPLRAYSAGGIANSPQLAMFGEGSLPEAYVPLPDGKSIPVSMKGPSTTNNNQTQNGSPVSISISVQSNGTSSSSQEGNAANQWAGLASNVKNMVVQEIANQKRPGGALYS